jgi:hypothetical protein
MTDMRGRRTRIQAPGVDPAGIDPAAVKMRRRVGGEMPATHMHGATAEMGTAATHTHGAAAAAAKVSSATATAEMGATTAATAEVSTTTAASSADVTTATAPAPTETSASRVSSRRQTKRYGYCGRACRDFPHGMTSSSGPNVSVNARSPDTVPADSKSVCCNAHVSTSRIVEHVRTPTAALVLDGLNFLHTEPPAAIGRIIG